MSLELIKTFYYRVKADETINDLCFKFNTCKENILRNNPNIKLYAGEWVLITKNDYKTHMVKPAETVDSVAKLYGVEKENLKVENNLVGDKLFIGQILKIK